jgi:NADPH:quinone reductase-like Zn-dependent oxidoreductase
VGSFAIQIAKHLGDQVATTASPRGEALVRQLGADMSSTTRNSDPHRFSRDSTVAFDLIGGDTLEQTFAIVRPAATVVSVGGMAEPQTASKDMGRGFGWQALFWVASFSLRRRARQRGARYRFLYMHPSGEDLSELGRLVDAGAVKVILDSVYPFERSDEAMAKLESGRAKGKIVVTMPDSQAGRGA